MNSDEMGAEDERGQYESGVKLHGRARNVPPQKILVNLDANCEENVNVSSLILPVDK